MFKKIGSWFLLQLQQGYQLPIIYFYRFSYFNYRSAGLLAVLKLTTNLFVYFIYLHNRLYQSVISVFVDVLDIRMKFLDGTKNWTQFFTLQTFKKFILGENIFDECSKYLWEFLVSDGSLLQTYTMHEVYDIYKCLIVNRHSLLILQQIEQQVDYFGRRGQNVVNKVRILPADTTNQLDSL